MRAYWPVVKGGIGWLVKLVGSISSTKRGEEEKQKWHISFFSFRKDNEANSYWQTDDNIHTHTHQF